MLRKISPNRAPMTAVTFELPEDFNVSGAITLPAHLKELPASASVTLDFRRVRGLTEGTLFALIPALASVRNRLMFSEGLSPHAQQLVGQVGVHPAAVVELRAA